MRYYEYSEGRQGKKGKTMEQQYNGNGTVTVWVDGAELRVMESNDLAIFHTPGSSQVYVSNSPNFQDDYAVATPARLLRAMGYDESDGLTADDVVELTVKLRG